MRRRIFLPKEFDDSALIRFRLEFETNGLEQSCESNRGGRIHITCHHLVEVVIEYGTPLATLLEVDIPVNLKKDKNFLKEFDRVKRWLTKQGYIKEDQQWFVRK